MNNKAAYQRYCSLIRNIRRVTAIKHRLYSALTDFSGGWYEYSHVVDDLEALQDAMIWEARELAEEYFLDLVIWRGSWTVAGLYGAEDKYVGGAWVRRAVFVTKYDYPRNWHDILRRAEAQFCPSGAIPF
jgi:hypothetical protein